MSLNFSSLKEINAFVDKVKININTQLQLKQYCKSIGDVYQKAEIYWKNKDDENAYILFMRCFNTYQAIIKSYEFTKAKSTFAPLLKDVKPLECVHRSEKLQKILELRYEDKKKQQLAQRSIAKANKGKPIEFDDLDLPDVPDDFKTENSSSNEDKKKDSDTKVESKLKTPTKDFITVLELYEMFKTYKDQTDCILIIDVRDSIEFSKWKVQHNPTINISHDFIQSNSNLNSIERCLRKETWEIFNQRFQKKFIVIVDDQFDETQSSEVLATIPAFILQEILCKCEGDFSVLVLKGGIQKWVLHYPSMTENPDYNRMKKRTTNGDMDDVTKLLQNVSYPSLPSLTKKKEQVDKPPEPPNKDTPKQININTDTDKLAAMRRMLSDDSGPDVENMKDIDKNEQDTKAINSAIKPVVNNFIGTEIEENNTKQYKNIKPMKEQNITPKNNILKDTTTSEDVGPQEKGSNNAPSTEMKKGNNHIKELKTTPGLPSGWQKMVDQNSGKVYYIDHNTKTTHWALPDGIFNNLTSKATVSKPNHNNIQPSSNNSARKQNESTKPNAHSGPSQKKPNELVSKIPNSAVPPVVATQKPPPSTTLPTSTKEPIVGPVLNPPQQFFNPNPQNNQHTIQKPSGEDVSNQLQKVVRPQQPKQILQTPKQTIIPQTPDISIQPPPAQFSTVPFHKPTVSLQPQPSVPRQEIINKPPNRPAVSNIPTQPKSHLREEQKIPATSRVPKNTMDVPKQPSLKRSLSSPNLAENLANIKANKPKTPIVDRGSKPLIPSKDSKPTHLVSRSSKPLTASRLRSLSPVYGSQGLSLTGLKNLGNTCYMNSVLQCLANTPPLVRYFSTGLYEKDLNTERINTNPRPGLMAQEFAFLMKVLLSGTYRSVSPVEFKLALGSLSSRFLTYEQQDSHEVLLIVLDGLHNDVNKAKVRSILPKRENNKLPDEKAASLEWDDNLVNNDSLIFNMFQGQFCSTVCCLTCKYQSKTFNTFNCLHLQLPVSKHATLAQCLELFVKPEKIDSWRCDRCNRDREAAKKIELWKMPPVLVVQFKRFRCEGIWTNKIQTPVDYPLANWNIGPHITGPSKKFSNYNLYGIINHSGSFESGHYTARCRNASVGGNWFLYNDEKVSDLSSVKTKEAYVLFYTAVNFEDYVKR